MRAHLDPAILARIMDFLERTDALGGRGARWPAWLEARLEASVEALLARRKLSANEFESRLGTDDSLRTELVENLRVGETRFYRDPEQWNALRREFLPKLDGPRVSVLSAGCSTGEEAWTLAMLLAEARAERPFKVVAMEKSTSALAAAELGTYASESTRNLPPDLARRYLEPATNDQRKVHASLRSRVTFSLRDLLLGPPPLPYDLIVCKNVLIYFGEQAQERALASLEQALAPDGLLVVAKSEVPCVRAFGMRAVELAPGVTTFLRRR